MLLTVKFEANLKLVKEKLSAEGYGRFNKFLTDYYWTDTMTSKQMLDFAMALKESGASDLIDASLVYGDSFEMVFRSEINSVGHQGAADDYIYFQQDDIMKKIFLAERSRVWAYDTTVIMAVSHFLEVDDFEDAHNVSILDFNDRQIKETIIGLYKGHRLQLLYSKVRILATYSRSYKGQAARLWDYYKTPSVLAELMGSSQTISDKLITKENLVNLYRDNPNPQFAIIPILIFEGVRFSTVDEVDELRFIRNEDVYQHGIFLRSGGTSAKGRFLELDKDVIKMVKTAMRQKEFYGNIRRNDKAVFEETGYLLKPAGSRLQKNPMSYSGVRIRYQEFEENAAMVYGCDQMGTIILQNCGKVHHIRRQVDSGVELNDALIKTLERYNDYEYFGDGDGKSSHTINESNRTRLNRLRTVWITYKNLIGG